MKRIKLVSVDIQADFENLLVISKEIADIFGKTIYDNHMIEAEEFSEREVLNGYVDCTYCPNDYIIETYKRAVNEKKDTFVVYYETPYFEIIQKNGAKMLKNDKIKLTFFIIND